MEAKFKDVNFAREQYPEVVKRFIDFGVSIILFILYSLSNLNTMLHLPQTTTCCYYGTLHLEATKILAEEVIKQGEITRTRSSCFVTEIIGQANVRSSG